jgi:ubiquinone biosynthesis protein
VTFFLDIYRACLLQWMCLRWGAPLLLRRLLDLPPGRFTAGYRLRRIFESMGVTYIKLGQYLAIRYDLLPLDICRELANLLNQVAPMDFPTVRTLVERELGGPLGAHFLSFEEHPVGSASIAQVHRAISSDGQLLAVKLQRPEVEAVLNADIRNLLRIGWLADRLRLLGAISLVEIVKEVAAYTLREVDFIQEGRMADQIRLDSPTYIKIPAIRWDLTTRRLLSMEFIEGISMLRIVELSDSIGDAAFERLLPGVDSEKVVDNLANACLRQLFITGRFHGDPHFANIIVGGDGTIAFIDFGIFGNLDAAQRKAFADLLEAMTAGLDEKAYRCYLKLATPTEDTDLRLYHRDMLAVLGKWHRVVADPTAETLEKLSVGFQTQVLQLMRRHHVRTQPDQILFWRTIGWLDILAHRVSPNIDLLAIMGRFFHAHRPSRAERFLAHVTSETRLAEAAAFSDTASDLPLRLAARLGAAAGNGRQPVLRTSTSSRPEENLPAKQISLALMAGAIALIAANPDLNEFLRASAGAVSAVFSVLAVFSWKTAKIIPSKTE